MSMQNWNMSEYVTIIHCPPFFLSEGAKRRFPSAKAVGAARLPFIGSTTAKLSHFSAKSNPDSNRNRGFV